MKTIRSVYTGGDMQKFKSRITGPVIIAGLMVVTGCVSNNIIGPGSSNIPPMPDYSDMDAVYLAYSVIPSLLPDQIVYTQIRNDLAAIRDAFPDMERVHHHSNWLAGQVRIKLTEQAAAQYEAGTYHGFDSLNAIYGPIEGEYYSGWSRSLTLRFVLPYYPDSLADIYRLAEGVERTSVNGTVGDGSRLAVNFPSYRFTYGWGDCPSGCIYYHTWVFNVTDDSVVLVSESGWPPPWE
jgi:hypothetical protein